MIWTHAVVTPSAKFSYQSPEYQGWKLCDSNELNKQSLSTFLLNAIEEQLKKIFQIEIILITMLVTQQTLLSVWKF